MFKLNPHTPDGMSDMLWRQTNENITAINNIMNIYRSFGYKQVQTPVLEYNDLFAEEFSNIYNLLDNEGRLLCLRPEMTISVARMAATKLRDFPMPLRLSYVGQAFRKLPPLKSEGQNEFTQSGIECFDNQSASIDAEIIAATIDALKSCGLQDLLVELGDAGLLLNLAQTAGMQQHQFTALQSFIDRKDRAGIIKYLDNAAVNQELKEIIISLPEKFGSASVLDDFNRENLPKQAQNAVNNLVDVYKILCDNGYEKHISIDLGMVRSNGYYDGIIFKCYAKGTGFSIAGGGRYDGLMRKFNSNIGAAGGCIWVQRLLSALFRQGTIFSDQTTDLYIVYNEKSRSKAFYQAQQQRAMNKNVTLLCQGQHTHNLEHAQVMYIKDDN